VSRPPFDSLNISFGVGDSGENVLENRLIIQEKMNVPVLLSARQVHGESVYTLDTPLKENLEVENVDSLITNQKGVGLLIQQADCQAVLLHDPKSRVAGAVHCGWRGSVANVLGKTVARMVEDFGVSPGNLQGVIGPSLGPCCGEFVNYKSELPASFLPFMTGSCYFDFWEISRHQLLKAGLSATRIATKKICTCCSTDFFSYRRSRRQGDGITGRNCSVIIMD
jgi:YfiH family protein